MNGPGDIPLTLSSTPDTRPCSLISIIPTLGMSSCRGRAEAFARRLSSKLRTLGSQTEDDPISPEGEPIINGGTTNTWMSSHNDGEQTVTDLQPLRHESDSFFDFDCESPGSPVDECEYLRLIDSASNTPHNSTESGYVCASAASSHSSTDAATFHDAMNHVDCNASNNGNAVHGSSSYTSPTRNIMTDGCDETDFVSVNKKIQGNDATEKLTNGHNHHETEKPIGSPLHTAPTDDQCDMNGPAVVTAYDASTTAVPSRVAENAASHDICDREMIRMQADIINDLQKQSDVYRDEQAHRATTHDDDAALSLQTSASCASETREATSEPINAEQHTQTTTTTEAAATPSPPSTHTQHTISLQTCEPVEPGGEEVLQIEVTEQQQQLNHKDEATETETETELVSSESSETFKTATTTPTPTPTATSPTKSVVEATEPQPSRASPTENTETNAKSEKNNNARNSTLDTTDDEDECRPQRVRRCSSLKTGKTPPGTPGRKKIVRFADVLGLDLADVKTFLDEVPTIPKSAFEDLEIMESEAPVQLGPKSDKLLMPLFQQPGGLATFLDIVREKQVSLENAAVTDHVNQTITGSVRVRNLDFHKSVHIRYSLDGWRSFADLQANYVKNSCDGFSDKFTFILFGNTLQIGQRLEFAVRFQCKGQQFWDNNYGANYCFQCLPSSSNSVTQPLHQIVPSHHAGQAMGGMLSPTVGDAWCSSFY